MKNFNILVVTGLIVGLGAGFFGGMQYQKSKIASPQSTGTNGQARGRFGGTNANGQRPVIGSILSADANSMTVKLSDGSSKVVLLSASTMINKTDPAQASDLKSGENVLVTGTTNSDGSVTAQNVQLNPMFRGGDNPQSSMPPQGQ